MPRGTRLKVPVEDDWGHAGPGMVAADAGFARTARCRGCQNDPNTVPITSAAPSAMMHVTMTVITMSK